MEWGLNIMITNNNLNPKLSRLPRTNKLLFLWEMVTRLVSQYENFDSRLITLEHRIDEANKKIGNMTTS